MRNVVEELKRLNTLTILFVESELLNLNRLGVLDCRYSSWHPWSLVSFLPSARMHVALSPLSKLQNLSIYTQARTFFYLPPHIRATFSPSPYPACEATQLRSIFGLATDPTWNEPRIAFRGLNSSHLRWGPVDALNSFLKANSHALKHQDLADTGSLPSTTLALNSWPNQLCVTETRNDLSTLFSFNPIFLRPHDMNAIHHSTPLHLLVLPSWKF